MPNLRFSAHHIPISQPYELGQRIAFQGEAEIIKNESRYNGKDGESEPVYTACPLVVEVQGLKDGIYQEPEISKTSKKSWIYMHRLKVREYWDQQLKHKYPDFDIYWNAYKAKLDQNIEEKLK